MWQALIGSLLGKALGNQDKENEAVSKIQPARVGGSGFQSLATPSITPTSSSGLGALSGLASQGNREDDSADTMVYKRNNQAGFGKASQYSA